MPWLPEAHERITPEPDRASLLGRIAHHVRVPAFIARRWAMCPYCHTVRRDPTDYCPRCHL